MFHSIGEVAERYGVNASTLRYYENKGLLVPACRTKGGIRRYDEVNLSTLTTIECLKDTGMSIAAIKLFFDWCSEGDCTLEKRHALFKERKRAIEEQIAALTETLRIIDYTCDYYAEACEGGTIDTPSLRQKLAEFRKANDRFDSSEAAAR